MPSPAHCGRVLFLILLMSLLGACTTSPFFGPATRTRLPTFTPVATGTAPPTPQPIFPTIVPSPTVAAQAAVAQVPKQSVTHPLLPVFGPFPPKPIPSRPANVNPLTGLSVDSALLQRRPLLVRIGNDEKVRSSYWQAGLNSADLVFEELIDVLGGAYANTRYTAVYLSSDPPLIGPVRSGRIVNFQLVPMLDGALVHAGASDGTRWLFSVSPMTNLDEFWNQPAYCYEKSHGYQGRLYTTGPRLREWLIKKGWEKPTQLYGFSFAGNAPTGLSASTIALTKAPWPKWAQVEWRYDASKGVYLRYASGTAQIDNSYQVTAKWGNGADCISSGPVVKTQDAAGNVVVLYAKHEKTDIVEDSNNAVSVHIFLTGQGDANFFRDGIMVKGKWMRQSEQEFFSFLDASGNPYSLKPGNTWFEIVPTGYALDVK